MKEVERKVESLNQQPKGWENELKKLIDEHDLKHIFAKVTIRRSVDRSGRHIREIECAWQIDTPYGFENIRSLADGESSYDQQEEYYNIEQAERWVKKVREEVKEFLTRVKVQRTLLTSLEKEEEESEYMEV